MDYKTFRCATELWCLGTFDTQPLPMGAFDLQTRRDFITPFPSIARLVEALDPEDIQQNKRCDDHWLELGQAGKGKRQAEPQPAALFEHPKRQNQARCEKDIKIQAPRC
jgi:hypothetical protein